MLKSMLLLRRSSGMRLVFTRDRTRWNRKRSDRIRVNRKAFTPGKIATDLWRRYYEAEGRRKQRNKGIEEMAMWFG